MAKSKFYARWRKPSGEEEVINAFQALYLREKAVIETRPKEVAVLFDLETGLKVSPTRGRKSPDGTYKSQPHFSYYSGETSPLKGLEGSFEYSSELNVFLEAFKNIKYFQIQEDDEVIQIYPKRIHRFYRVATGESPYFILKFLIELEYTIPYSAYYRFNGRLGLELYVTSQSRPRKRVELGKMGIPLFEAKARFPEYTEHLVRENYTRIEDLNYLAQEIRTVYEEKDYRLLGHFNQYHMESFVFLDDNERRYDTLKSYEEQCAELLAEIRRIEESLAEKNEKANRLGTEIVGAQKRLQQYRAHEEYYKKLEKENKRLRHEKEELQSDHLQLQKRSQRLFEERNAAQKEVEAIRNRPLWKKLLNLY